MLTILRLALASVYLSFASIAVASAQVPLPDDVSVTPPTGDVSTEIAAFNGAWAGDGWDGSVPHALVVERIESDGSAQVMYALGASHDWGTEPVWYRLTGKFVEHRLVVALPDGATADYAVLPDGVLFGRRTLAAGWRSYVRLKHIPSVDPHEIILAAAAAAPTPIWEEIRIPVHSEVGSASGQTLMLQATLYRTSLPGRRPLAVLNHGYAGKPGERHWGLLLPSYANQTFRYEEEARFFLALGENVVVPMRKGRGASEGPYLEWGEARPNDTINSGVEDLKAVISYMDDQPYVDPQRIVVAGVSRGGILSVVYASRYPDGVAGVINFSGGWWYASTGSDTNTRWFAEAGSKIKVPTLWLYAEGDTFSPLADAEQYFEAFRSAGGKGRLIEVHGITGEGHALFGWTGKWTAEVTDYLKGLSLVP
jgi:dienelactone hydrolase